MPAAWFGGCQQKNQFQAPPPPKVTVAQPVRRPVVDTVQFTGTTRASATVNLRSRVTGYLKKVDFEDGANVEKDDLLFLIDQDTFEAELHSAKANLQKAQAELQLSQGNLARIQKLHDRGAATQNELEVQQAQAASDAATVEAAQAAVREAELQLNYTEIRAPISGRIGRHLVDEGNLVEAEQTLLATIESIEPIYAYFTVSERELLRFREMFRKNELVKPKEPPTLYLGLANEPGYPHVGKLDFRELGVDPATGTILRRGVFENPDHALIPGLFVRIQATLGSAKPRVLVEERAIGTDQRGNFLLVVNSDNMVEYRSVQLGVSVDGMRVVQKGVGPEDWVVINGLQRARPGAVVNPVRSKMTVPAGAVRPENYSTPDDLVPGRRNDALCSRDSSSNARSSPM